MPKLTLSPISRRLLPLYIAIFFQSIPLWYATEKIFMLNIGFNTASIGVMLAVMSVVMLIVETPSGILADRWSRKGVMVLGCLALLVSATIGVFSFSVPMYILSTAFWGIFAALYSGTYDAVIYDTTVEEYGDSKNFEKYLGRFKAIEGITFVIGALSGAFIASTFSLRDPYILSIPLIACALIFLWKFKEPQLHKAEVSESVFTHIRQTFAAVLRNPVLLPVVIATIGFSVLQEFIFELSQLWFIAVAAPIALYGVFNAAVFSSWTTGGLLAVRIKSKSAIIGLMVLTVSMVILLIASHQYLLVLIAQVVLAVCLIAIGVILAKKMHDELPSRLRAGSSSVISTIARIIIIPGSLLVTGIAQTYDMSIATYVLLAIAVVSVIAFMSIDSVKKQTS
ncbi:MAG: MFS transporter [Candidatus Saccharimonadaceae bacterium]